MAAPRRRVAVTILIRVTLFDDNNNNEDKKCLYDNEK